MIDALEGLAIKEKLWDFLKKLSADNDSIAEFMLGTYYLFDKR